MGLLGRGLADKPGLVSARFFSPRPDPVPQVPVWAESKDLGAFGRSDPSPPHAETCYKFSVNYKFGWKGCEVQYLRLHSSMVTDPTLD